MEQTTANQERELREIAGRVGYEIVKVYKDHGVNIGQAVAPDRISSLLIVMGYSYLMESPPDPTK